MDENTKRTNLANEKRGGEIKAEKKNGDPILVLNRYSLGQCLKLVTYKCEQSLGQRAVEKKKKKKRTSYRTSKIRSKETERKGYVVRNPKPLPSLSVLRKMFVFTAAHCAV